MRLLAGRKESDAPLHLQWSGEQKQQILLVWQKPLQAKFISSAGCTRCTRRVYSGARAPKGGGSNFATLQRSTMHAHEGCCTA